MEAVCLLTGRSTLTPTRDVLRDQATAPQPAEDAGCSGSPEGR